MSRGIDHSVGSSGLPSHMAPLQLRGKRPRYRGLGGAICRLATQARHSGAGSSVLQIPSLLPEKVQPLNAPDAEAVTGVRNPRPGAGSSHASFVRDDHCRRIGRLVKSHGKPDDKGIGAAPFRVRVLQRKPTHHGAHRCLQGRVQWVGQTRPGRELVHQVVGSGLQFKEDFFRHPQGPGCNHLAETIPDLLERIGWVAAPSVDPGAAIHYINRHTTASAGRPAPTRSVIASRCLRFVPR